MSGWRVWRAFEDEQSRPIDWTALRDSCRRADGRIDVDEYLRWLDVLVWYPRGRA